MTYYVGKNLQNRIQDYGLSELYTILHQYSLDQAPWPGTYQITPATPEQLEPIRVTIYSILHETATKPNFKVKMHLGSLLVEIKNQSRRVQTAGLINQPGSGLEPGRPGEAESEDLSGVFSPDPLD